MTKICYYNSNHIIKMQHSDCHYFSFDVTNKPVFWVLVCSASPGFIVLMQVHPRDRSKNIATSKMELFAIIVNSF